MVEESHSTTIKLHVDDIMDIDEAQEGCAYAIVSAIFKHRANNGHWYAFFLLTWFEATSECHSLEVPVYCITDANNGGGLLVYEPHSAGLFCGDSHTRHF